MQFYDEVLQADLPFPKRHTAEFLADRMERSEFTFTRRVEATVALHYHRATEPPRREGEAACRLPRAVPGLGGRVRARRALGADVHAVQAKLGMDVWRQMGYSTGICQGTPTSPRAAYVGLGFSQVAVARTERARDLTATRIAPGSTEGLRVPGVRRGADEPIGDRQFLNQDLHLVCPLGAGTC
jgi:hypothetical protein